ncbi:hypothetical protein BG000_002912 [Podila horticola]|nr:hypothetical protein BG000_002912 [Podila horticola]
MYIALGQPVYATQTFSLDLTSTWDTTSPKFTLLSNFGAPVDFLVPSTLLNDQSWLVISNNRSYRYNIQANIYCHPHQSIPYQRMDPVRCGATDVSTGLVYIPNGYFVSTPTLNTTIMMQYNVATGTTTSLPKKNGPNGVRAFAIAWNQAIRKLVVTSGFVNEITIHGLYTYDALAGWAQPTTTGATPPPREQHCMVSAGGKRVLFGGFAKRDVAVVLSDIWILDLTSWIWTQGTDAGASNARANHVCGYSNGQFIVWGGRGKDTIVTNNVTMIYNLDTQAWITTFVPNPAVVTTTTTASSRASGSSSSSTPTSSGASTINGADASGSKSNVGAIMGIVAAVVVIGAFAN